MRVRPDSILIKFLLSFTVKKPTYYAPQTSDQCSLICYPAVVASGSACCQKSWQLLLLFTLFSVPFWPSLTPYIAGLLTWPETERCISKPWVFLNILQVMLLLTLVMSSFMYPLVCSLDHITVLSKNEHKPLPPQRSLCLELLCCCLFVFSFCISSVLPCMLLISVGLHEEE